MRVAARKGGLRDSLFETLHAAKRLAAHGRSSQEASDFRGLIVVSPATFLAKFYVPSPCECLMNASCHTCWSAQAPERYMKRPTYKRRR